MHGRYFKSIIFEFRVGSQTENFIEIIVRYAGINIIISKRINISFSHSSHRLKTMYGKVILLNPL